MHGSSYPAISCIDHFAVFENEKAGRKNNHEYTASDNLVGAGRQKHKQIFLPAFDVSQ